MRAFFESPFKNTNNPFVFSPMPDKVISVDEGIHQGILQDLELNLLSVIYKYHFSTRLQIEHEYNNAYKPVKDLLSILNRLAEYNFIRIFYVDGCSMRFYAPSAHTISYMQHIGLSPWIPYKIQYFPNEVLSYMVFHQFYILWREIVQDVLVTEELYKSIQGIQGILQIDGFFQLTIQGTAVFFYVFVIRRNSCQLDVILDKYEQYTSGLSNAHALFLCEDLEHVKSLYRSDYLFSYDTLLDDPRHFLVKVQETGIFTYGNILDISK